MHHLGITGFASLLKVGLFFTRLFFSDFMRLPRGVVLFVIVSQISSISRPTKRATVPISQGKLRPYESHRFYKIGSGMFLPQGARTLDATAEGET